MTLSIIAFLITMLTFVLLFLKSFGIAEFDWAFVILPFVLWMVVSFAYEIIFDFKRYAQEIRRIKNTLTPRRH